MFKVNYKNSRMTSMAGLYTIARFQEYIIVFNFFQPYESLVDSTWYHGKIDRSQVNTLLKQDGDFIVREKSDNSGDQVLSVLWHGHTKHFILKPDENVSIKNHVQSCHLLGGVLVKNVLGSNLFEISDNEQQILILKTLQ